MCINMNDNFGISDIRNNKKYLDAVKMGSKELGTSLIASMIQHMNNKSDIDRRSYLITIHLNALLDECNPYRRPMTQDKFNLLLYKCINDFTHNHSPQKNPHPNTHDSVGLLVAADVNGSRDGKQIDTAMWEEVHLHCLLILPFEIDDVDLKKRFVALLAAEIHTLNGVKKSRQSRKSESYGSPHVQVKSFVDDMPLWYLADYIVKSHKKGNEVYGKILDYQVFPWHDSLNRIAAIKSKYGLNHFSKQAKKDARTIENKKSSKQQRKKAAQRIWAADRMRKKISSNKDEVEKQMRLRPSDFYYSPICRDISKYQQDLYFKGITKINQVTLFQDLNLKRSDQPRVCEWVYRCLPEQVSSDDVAYPAPAADLHKKLDGFWHKDFKRYHLFT